MEKGRIILITGTPGTGKTTAAALAAEHSALERSVHMHMTSITDALGLKPL